MIRQGRRVGAARAVAGFLVGFIPAGLLSAQLPCGSNAYLLEVAPGSSAEYPSSGYEVILIHGFIPGEIDCGIHRHPGDYFHINSSSAGAEWTFLVRDLNQRGVRVWTWKWPTQAPMFAAGDLLRGEIESQPGVLAYNLVLVGHSLGGLVALRALSGDHPLGDRVVRVLTLGSPHLGTTAGFLNLIQSNAAREARPGSGFLTELRARRTARYGALTFAFGGVQPEPSNSLCRNDGFVIDLTLGSFSDCVVPTCSAYDNWNQQSPPACYGNPPPSSPLHVVTPFGTSGDDGGYYLGYNHSHMALDYTERLPRDPSQGADLVAKVRQLLVPNGDLNYDGLVNVTDLGNLLSRWQKADRPPADINQDNHVDVIDLSILLFHWSP